MKPRFFRYAKHRKSVVAFSAMRNDMPREKITAMLLTKFLFVNKSIT